MTQSEGRFSATSETKLNIPKPTREPVRGYARAKPEHDQHGLTLWSRQPLEPIEHRCARLMQTRVGRWDRRANRVWDLTGAPSAILRDAAYRLCV